MKIHHSAALAAILFTLSCGASSAQSTMSPGATSGDGKPTVRPGSSPTASGDPTTGRAGTGAGLGGGPTSSGTSNAAQTKSGGPAGGFPDRN